ncbi:MAG TPA: hypothetical protein VEK73_03580 [Xanthobacteraceae bacterium]|nr:hypothetical protein [Xanthobacteraceae bacterium]
MIALVLGGMALPAPYINPLTPDQVDRLRISEVHFADPGESVDARIVSRAKNLIRLRIVERLGAKFISGRGNSDLIVTINTLQVDGTIEQPRRVEIAVSATIVQSGVSASYSSGGVIVGRVQTATGEISAAERLPMAAQHAADGLVNLILTK